MSIVLEHLTKRYAGQPVVNHVSLEINAGEFFVLLGPSGSGKSTVLRMIAGLTDIDQGRILLHGRDVTHLPAQRRDAGFVFQHYALFRHMSVADNIEFALRVRKVAASERRRRRDDLLELVGLAGLGHRRPHQLSGGQQQRVALARALAHQPAVLLLDEPFGALDAKIRTELRQTLKHVQRELGMTTIFVTHDQEEAFELADRLGVMNAGRLLEVGPPDELYQRPQTEFVATFLGTANLLLGQCTSGGVQIGPLRFPLATEPFREGEAQRVQILFRPEDVVLAADAEALPGQALGQGVVERSTFVGSFERLRLRLPSLPGVRPLAPAVPFGSDAVLIDALRSQEQARRFPLQIGDHVSVGVHRMHALTHPGMRFLLVSDGSPASQTALAVGGKLAQQAHARTTLLGSAPVSGALDQHLQAVKEQIGSGLPSLNVQASADPLATAIRHEVEREPHDLVVLGVQDHKDPELAEQVLQFGEHHLLLVPGAGNRQVPARFLLCVTSGEPGKEDVRFAGRLARHLGAEATLLSVLSGAQGQSSLREKTERFLAAGVRTLASLGVAAHPRIREGNVRDEILAELATGDYGLIVLGAPLSDHNGHRTLAGVVGHLVSTIDNHPVLIVRSRYATRMVRTSLNGRAAHLEEIGR